MKLRYRWSKKEKDFLISFPNKPDGHLVHGFFEGYTNGKDFLKELEKRGYDLTTLKFEVSRKQDVLNEYQCELIRDLDNNIDKYGIKSPEVKAFVDDCVDYQAVAVMQLWMERKKMHLSHAYDRVFFTCVDTFVWVFIPGVVGCVIGGIIVGLAYTVLGGICSFVGHICGRT